MMLFIWCFVSTLAPYPMNSFFVSFFYLSAVLTYILQKQPQPAIATFEKLTNLDSQNPYAWTYLGFVHLYNWQGAQAQVAFDKAAQIAPQLPELRTLNIVAAAMQFNIPKALQLLNAPK
jgi:tetratricopeptide (TPR) repeat protein